MENSIVAGDAVLTPEIVDTPNSNGEKRLQDPKTGKFVLGNPGGPGRPPGSISIKDLVRQHLEDNPEDLSEFVRHFIKSNRELAWQMLEGRPAQNLDHTSGGRPIPILGGVTTEHAEDQGTNQGERTAT